MKREHKRLYVAGKRKNFVYCMARNRAEAATLIGADCRIPNPDDLRLFWERSGIANMTAAERKEKFGISRQSANAWRRKGGEDLKSRQASEYEARIKRVQEVTARFPGMSAKAIASLARVSVACVRRLAPKLNISIGSQRKIPADEKLIELARGRTWREFADAVGLRLATLRHYIYQSPSLTAAIREVRKPEPLGKAGKNKIDLTKVMAMGQKGMTAYAIAEVLKVEQMTIRAHLKKWGKEFPHEFPPPYGNRRTTS